MSCNYPNCLTVSQSTVLNDIWKCLLYFRDCEDVREDYHSVGLTVSTKSRCLMMRRFPGLTIREAESFLGGTKSIGLLSSESFSY